MSNRRQVSLLAVVVLCVLLAVVAAHAQTPGSCATNGFTGYRYTYSYDGGSNTTTYQFTFCNRSPIFGVYVNIGEVFFFGLPSPTSTLAPSGWAFFSPGPMLSFQTTSNPWWKTPPAIKPGDCLSGFTYVISGVPDLDFQIVMHVQNVTDATGQQMGALGTWFDCAQELPPPPVDEPCIDVMKMVNPDIIPVGGNATYTVVVTNCGNTDLDVTSLDDDNPAIGSILAAFIAANGGSSILPVGGSVTINYNYMATESSPNPLENCVTVQAEYDSTEVEDTDCATLYIMRPMDFPSITLSKIVYPDNAPVGGQVTYEYTVCNNGNADLTVNSLVDTMFGDLYSAFYAANGNSNSLPIGACVTFHVYYTIQSTDLHPLLNCATVTAVDPEETEVVAMSCARVDINSPTQRRCYLPVTFTQMGWRMYSDPYDPALPGGVIYNRFPIAFSTFSFYGTLYKNRVIVGYPGKYTLTYVGTTLGLNQLCNLFPQIGVCGQLYASYTNPPFLVNKSGVQMPNALAGEALALTMNIAYNDMRVMPRTPGYDLENFTITQGLLKGKTVRYALNLANKVLGGTQPMALGIPSCDALTNILMNINRNYEFVDFNTFYDRGYLKPNRTFGQPDPPHIPVVP